MKEGENIEGGVYFENNWENYKKYLIIGIILLILILAIVLVFIFKREDMNKSEPDLSECLEKDMLDNDCIKVFSDSRIYENCESLQEFKERCFYHSAFYYNHVSFCGLIEDLSLRDKCFQQIIISGGDF